MNENESLRRRRAGPDFTSRLSKGETFAVLAYFPVHLLILPTLLVVFFVKGYISEAQTEFLRYAVGAVFMLIFAFRFLRRDFDPLCDNILYCVLEILGDYFAMLAFNIVVNSLLSLVIPSDGNPNNNAVVDLFLNEHGLVAAMAVFLAPITEEVMFRAGIFGTLRRYNRAAAYVAGVLLFSLYHVWGYAIADPIYFLYMLQYVPVSYLLCRCYERTNSIWASIFFHMFINFAELRLVDALAAYM